MTKVITLTQGKEAIVDDSDYEELAKYKWHYRNMRFDRKHTGYAARSYWEGGKSHRVFMHQAIARPQPGYQVDHINGNGLDNRRCNLRVCSAAENKKNKTAHSGSKTSVYKGVYRHGKKWVAQIGVNRTTHYLGTFENEVDAAMAYNDAAMEYFGEFAKFNEVP